MQYTFYCIVRIFQTLLCLFIILWRDVWAIKPGKTRLSLLCHFYTSSSYNIYDERFIIIVNFCTLRKATLTVIGFGKVMAIVPGNPLNPELILLQIYSILNISTSTSHFNQFNICNTTIFSLIRPLTLKLMSVKINLNK